MIKKGGINYKLEKKLPNVTQSWFPAVPNRFLSASLNKLHCIAGQQPSRNPKNKQTNSIQLNSTQLNASFLSVSQRFFPTPPQEHFQDATYLHHNWPREKASLPLAQSWGQYRPMETFNKIPPPPPRLDHMCFTLKMGEKNPMGKKIRRIPTLEIIIKLQGVSAISAVKLWGDLLIFQTLRTKRCFRVSSRGSWRYS